MLDILVAAVNLCNVRNTTGALCTQRCDEQGDTRTDIRTRHAAGTKGNLAVVTDDHSPMGIAKDNLCTHIDELVNEEQTALKHLLMEEHTTFRLRCHHQQDGDEVWRQSWPRGIGERHDGAVDKRLDDVVRLLGNPQVVALNLDLHTQTAEGCRDDT